MAAALLRDRIARLGLEGEVEILSAGVWAREGQEASQQAVAVLGSQGIDLAEHRSQPVNLALLDKAKIILVMEENHRRSLFYLAPQYLGKVFLLAEMAGQHDDVTDPYGGTPDDYVRTADLLGRLIEAGMPNILRRLSVAPATDSASSTTQSEGRD